MYAHVGGASVEREGLRRLGVAHCTAQKVMAQMVIAALLLLTAHVAVCQNEVRVVWSVEGVRQYQG